MKTNEIFSLKRFGKYFASDFRTCTSNYGLSLLTITLLTPIVLYVLFIAFNGLFEQIWEGPGIFMRGFIFFIAMFCITVTMPVKCYGRLTDKQYGSFWISLPASKLEKFLSMIIMTCILVPVIGLVLYIAADWLICLMDKTCGTSLIGTLAEIVKEIRGAMPEVMEEIENELGAIGGSTYAHDFLKQLSSPWLYIDEYFCLSLPFLLGAIFFKKGKTVKTFLAIAASSTIISMLVSPLFAGYYLNLLNGTGNEEQIVIQMFESGIFKNLVWIDIISDAIFNIAILTGIWFRIKSLKH